MNEKDSDKTVLRLSIENAALRNAWRNKCAFTVRDFCEKYGYKDTRYLRSILKEMVSYGDLCQFYGSGDTNRDRLYFCAQQTDMIAIFKENLQ